MKDQTELSPDRLQCGHCGEMVQPLGVVYGLPTPETESRARRGDFMLGGCIVDQDSPTWACPNCGRYLLELGTLGEQWPWLSE